MLVLYSHTYGGDGGSPYDTYVGRGQTQFVLYTDGHLLVRDAQARYHQAVLTTAEMCTLLHQISSTGFFQVTGNGQEKELDPIYKFDASAQFTDNGEYYVLQVNGSPAKHVSVFVPYDDYVAAPIKALQSLLDHYQPGTTQPFKALKLLLWVQGPHLEWAWQYPPGTSTPTVQAWPATLPPLADFLNGAEEKQVYLQGEAAAAVQQLSDKLGVFTDQGAEYFVIVRELLPHETEDNFDAFPSAADEYELPFACAS